MKANRAARQVRLDSAAVSDVLGSILMVGITVVMAVALGLLLFSFDGPADSQHTSLVIAVGPGADLDWGVGDAELRLTHLGGESLRQGETQVVYTPPGGSPIVVDPTFAGGRLSIGQTWTHVISAEPGDSIDVRIIVRTGGSSVLLANAVQVAGADLNIVTTYVTSVSATAGSVASFASAQSADDGGAAASLSEAPLAGGGGGTVTLTGTGTTNSGATNPGNVFTSNDIRATLSATSNYVEANGFSAPGGAVSVSQVLIGFEVQGTATSVTVAHVATVTNTGSGGTTVASPSVTAASGNFYIVAIANGDSPVRTVSSVAGMGLAWSRVATQTNSVALGNIEVWRGSGTATTGAVTATFTAAVDRSAIAVSRYSGVDLTNPVQASTTAEAAGTGSATISGVTAVAGTTNGLFYVASNVVAQSGTALTTPSNERAEVGTQQVQMAVTDGAAAASNTAAGSVSGGSADWQLIALTLRPLVGATPTATLSYTVSGVAGATTLTVPVTAADQSYTVDVTGDRAWTVADILQLGVRATATDASGGPVLLDHAFATTTTVASPTTYRLDVSMDVGGVPTASSLTLQMRYRVNSPGDTFTFSVWTGSAWRTCPGTLSSTAFLSVSCPLVLPNEYNTGTPRVRFQDVTPSGTLQGALHLDYVRVVGI